LIPRDATIKAKAVKKQYNKCILPRLIPRDAIIEAKAIKNGLKGYPKQPKGCQKGAQIDQRVAKMDSETAQGEPMRKSVERGPTGTKFRAPFLIQNTLKTQLARHWEINDEKVRKCM
jgi:hypothetical protein